MGENYYWSVVYHKTETSIHDYLVYLFNTQEEAIQSIKERQVGCGKKLGEKDINDLVDKEIPIFLDRDTIVSISLVKKPLPPA